MHHGLALPMRLPMSLLIHSPNQTHGWKLGSIAKKPAPIGNTLGACVSVLPKKLTSHLAPAVATTTEPPTTPTRSRDTIG